MTNEEQVLNGSNIKQIAAKSDTALTLMEYLASRERNRHVTDLNRVRNNLVNDGKRVVYADLVDTAKELEKLKLGSFIYGRNGDPDRFEWYYSLKAIGQSGLDGKDILAEQLPTQQRVKKRAAPKVTKKVVYEKPKANTSETKAIIFLRDNFELNIPSNITAQEVNMIKRTLDKLVA